MKFLPFVLVLTACSASVGDPPRPAPSQKTSVTVRPAVAPSKEPLPLDGGNGQRDAVTPPVPPGIDCLKAGYGRYIAGVEYVSSRWFVVMSNGTRFVYDDHEEKSFEERLDAPDLQDQLSIAYPAGREYATPEENDDPGRIRQEAFFRAVYGATGEEVQANLIAVPWLPRRLGKRVRFNRRNGAADALEKVSEALDERLPKDAIRYISQPAGTYNWRRIAGTDRLSAHSFGIAVDINVEVSHYWRWETNGKPLVYRNRIPLDIVEMFEAHGFIWGGKWYHFDTMHFEYRPELLASACLR